MVAAVRCASSDGSIDAARDGAASDAAAPDRGDRDGKAMVTPPPAESGFIDVAPQPSTFRGRGRMFYSFQPSEGSDGVPKPLLVFFNGGPGAATSTLLTAFGTGRYSVPRRQVLGTLVVPNPRSFVRFANLLFVDARNTGFSYELRPDDGRGLGSCVDFVDEDAADMNRVVLRFLAAHPAIRNNAVVLVGESYGGIRAVTMMQQLLHYRDPAMPIADDLRDEMEAHFDAVWPPLHGGELHPAEQIITQFGRAVFIQPLVGGDEQRQIAAELIPHDPYLAPYVDSPAAAHDVRESGEWIGEIGKRAASALADEEASRALLQFDLGRIEAFLPAARASGWRIHSAIDREIEESFRARFGPLETDDQYLSYETSSCGFGATSDERIFPWFLELLPLTRFFLTNARYDLAIHTPAIVELLRQRNRTVTVDDAPRANVDRPGWIRLTLTRPESGQKEVAIRYPLYADSGHAVTIAQGAELADDVRDWLGQP
jgi:hypothetical protein